MKIIVSTKILSIEIDRAINKKFNEFCISRNGKTFKIYNLDLSQEFSIDVPESEETTYFLAEFNHLKWFKVLEFLKTLIEQPIILDIENVNDDEVEITLSGFIHKI